ncbi:MAG: hypothetical protein LBG58_11405 [Planctomycetaceae bacterium]|jgi:hypothetical protein|nr:hypothetical protein [Planctomycetaceae bacterium]
MWRTPFGTKTFSGTYALMLARGILELIDRIQESLDEEDDDFRVGHRAFDCLTLEQKIWTLHKVTHGLLDKKTPACELSAFVEATIACIFCVLEDGVMIEIDMANDYDDAPEENSDDSYDRFYWRKTLFAPYYELIKEDNATETSEGEKSENNEKKEEIEPIDAESEEEDDWEMVIEILESQVLWDADYDLDEFEDIDPDKSDLLKRLLGMHDAYFSSIPNDPAHPEALALLKETKKFCNGIVRREEKLLKK